MTTKNILFLVTGMTPQIITETVYGLAVQPGAEDRWIPNEVHVLSTQDGLTQIRDGLLEKGNFQRLIDDYQLPPIAFDESKLHCFMSGDECLKDLKTPEDHEQSANEICELVRKFTADDQTRLHVSIAGGRKTMGFYAGYALSLYGRAQDSMSHVLVEDRFENIREFYYPTPESRFVTNREGKTLDAKDAQIWLANIPFVRMKDAIKEKHQLRGQDRFIAVVHKINQSFKNVQLKIDLDRSVVLVNNEFLINSLPPREFALLHWFADQRRKGTNGIRAPKIHASAVKPKQEDADYLQLITAEFIRYYDEVKNVGSDFVVDKKFFESVKSNLKSSLEKQLGLELAAKIAIRQEGKEQPFYLDIDPAAIEITNNLAIS